MGEISNRTLAVLVILAILVSLLSLFIGRARIVTVGQAETSTGVVQAQVQSDIDISVRGTPINFQSVYGGDRISSNSSCIGASCSTGGDDFWDTTPGCAYDGGTCNQVQCSRTYSTTGGWSQKLNVSSIGNTQANIRYRAIRSLFCYKWGTPDGCVNLGVGIADRTLDAAEDQGFQAKIAYSAAGGYGINRECNNLKDASWTQAEMAWRNVDIGTIQNVVNGCETQDFFFMFFKIMVPLNEPPDVSPLCPAGHTTDIIFTGVAT